MLAEGGDVVVEQQLQQPQPQQQQQQKPQKQQKQQKQQQRADLASETSIPPGLDQGVRREGMHKTVFDRTTSAVPRREISSTPVMESKPSEVSEVRTGALVCALAYVLVSHVWLRTHQNFLLF